MSASGAAASSSSAQSSPVGHCGLFTHSVPSFSLTTVERIVALGASVVDDRRGLEDGGWVVLGDPEGNEFCVLDRSAEDAGIEPA